MSSDVSCQKYPNPAGYEPCQTAAEKSNGPFLIRQSSGRCWKHRSGMSRWRWRSQWCFFLHDIMTNQDTEVTLIFTFGHWNIEIENWFVVFNHFLFFHSVGNVIIPTDEVHHFSEGLFYHQPENLLLNIPKSRVKLADPQQHRVKVNHLVEHITRPGKRLQKLWTDPPCWMGKFTIYFDWAIFNSKLLT